MRQLQFKYESQEQLEKILQRISKFMANKPVKVLFQIYSEQTDIELLNQVCNTVVTILPSAICVGGSCNGSVLEGAFSGNSISIGCTVFERESTQIEVLQYVLNADSAVPVANDLVQEIEKRPWVSAMGMLLASPGISFTAFCKELGKIRRDVQIFGGIASQIGDESPAFVFSNLCGFSDESVVCILYGGEDLHVETAKVSGWKPLGKPFTITKAEGNVLHELDGKPAFEAYSKYLNIQNDYYFFSNTLEFPLFYCENGENLLRSPLACSESGSLLLSSNMETGYVTRIAYGDPQTIMESVGVEITKLSKFVPNAIFVYSSLARRTFWGKKDVIKETVPFQSVAPTYGFFAAGEFMRARNSVHLYNVALVLVAMREGEINEAKMKTPIIKQTGRVSVISRLAHFTNVSSAELFEMYNRMTKNSITDALTGLYNRGEIQRRIEERFAEYPNEPMSLVMIDIDSFKSVNDTFGHKEGDNVIIGLSKRIQIATFENAPDADAGRWGGEEFMIMLPDMGIKEAVEFAEAVRASFSEVEFPAVGKKTISLGATELRKDDTSDSICVRVDEALYRAKQSGKNKVVVI